MAKVKALKRKNSRERLTVVNKGKLGYGTCFGVQVQRYDVLVGFLTLGR